MTEAQSNAAPLPGDDIIPNPEMLYNHSISIHAPTYCVFPWILQLGKGRGGWYLPSNWERVLPRSMHASRMVNEAWTALRVGDVVEDYGFDQKEDWFEVMEILQPETEHEGEGVGGREKLEWNPQRRHGALVYKSDRYGTTFSWTLIVRDLGVEEEGRSPREGWSEVSLRFRGRIQRTGWQRSVLVWGGGWMDWLSTWPLLRGLKERCEHEWESR